MTRPTLPTCRAHYPDGPDRCACRLLPRLRGLPRNSGGSASATSLARPAQASLTLRPVGLLNRPRRPLSRGFSPAGCPAEPLVSYQRNRQLAGWNLPPLVNRAVWARWIFRSSTTIASMLPVWSSPGRVWEGRSGDVCCDLVRVAGGLGTRVGGAQGADRTCVRQGRNTGDRWSFSRRLVVGGRAQNRLAPG